MLPQLFLPKTSGQGKYGSDRGGCEEDSCPGRSSVKNSGQQALRARTSCCAGGRGSGESNRCARTSCCEGARCARTSCCARATAAKKFAAREERAAAKTVAAQEKAVRSARGALEVAAIQVQAGHLRVQYLTGKLWDAERVVASSTSWQTRLATIVAQNLAAQLKTANHELSRQVYRGLPAPRGAQACY